MQISDGNFFFKKKFPLLFFIASSSTLSIAEKAKKAVSSSSKEVMSTGSRNKAIKINFILIFNFFFFYFFFMCHRARSKVGHVEIGTFDSTQTSENNSRLAQRYSFAAVKQLEEEREKERERKREESLIQNSITYFFSDMKFRNHCFHLVRL